MRRFATVFGFLAALLLAAEAPAAVYRYIDDRGVVHFTDVPPDQRYEWIPTWKEALTVKKPDRPRAKPGPKDQYDRMILRSARNHRMEPALVKAVIAAESNFKPRAVSRVGAQGLMQLMPATARMLGVENPFHPAENVEGGTRYLRDMLDRYGDLKHALAAYNAGPEAVDRYGGIPPYPETLDYVSRVLNYYRDYHAEFRRRAPRQTLPPARQTGGRAP